jgi:hypothetical protein
MMQECATPTVWLEAQVLRCAEILKKKNMHVPDLVMAGGFISETQIFKSIAMSNFGSGPLVKAVAMARAPITAAMKASYFAELAAKGALPAEFKQNYGSTPEQFFICTTELQNRFGDDFKRIPAGAIGVYTYYHDRIGTGLRQLMAGARKWRLDLLDRSDLASLTECAARVTGIPTIEEFEKDAMESILLS